jgi:hypothetical protein
MSAPARRVLDFSLGFMFLDVPGMLLMNSFAVPSTEDQADRDFGEMSFRKP